MSTAPRCSRGGRWRTRSRCVGYSNFDGRRDATAASTFPPEVRRRLVALKRRVDPDNVFRHNVNIDPGG